MTGGDRIPLSRFMGAYGLSGTFPQRASST